MSIYDDLIAAIDPLPGPVQIYIGPFLTAVSSGERCGLAATILNDHNHHSAIAAPGVLDRLPVARLARLVVDGSGVECSVGMAAINAALPHAEYLNLNGVKLLMEKAEGKRLAVVGHFPFVDGLPPAAKVKVIELNPRDNDIDASMAESVIAEADVVAITGSAFANRTIESLLLFARSKWVMVMGPTAPLSPVLFDYGVDAIAGSVVLDAEVTFREISHGAGYRQLSSVQKVILIK